MELERLENAVDLCFLFCSIESGSNEERSVVDAEQDELLVRLEDAGHAEKFSERDGFARLDDVRATGVPADVNGGVVEDPIGSTRLKLPKRVSESVINGVNSDASELGKPSLRPGKADSWRSRTRRRFGSQPDGTVKVAEMPEVKSAVMRPRINFTGGPKVSSTRTGQAALFRSS
jgi:hypothetical protein